MRITRLTLHGFKSFGNRTTLEFAPGVTAIVGPNGSGKSNVIDALRWTSGGGRAREFRAGDKTDLIFHGAAGKRGLGYAEVELELRAPGKRIHIQRSLARDGTSRLKLNGRNARFLDLDEELAGSGLGRGSLAVIGQGEVSGVLMADPAKLLEYVAEAAGVARLAGRREQTLGRLATARDHLDRLEDVLSEMRVRLELLEREAQDAARHADLTREALRLRLTAARARHDGLAQESARLREDGARLEAELAEGREALQARREALAEARRAATSTEEAYRLALADSEKRRGDLRVAEARENAARQRLATTEGLLREGEAERERLDALEPPTPPDGSDAALAAHHEALRAELGAAEAARAEAEAALRDAERERDALRARASAEAGAVAAFESRREELARQRDDATRRLAALPEDAAGESAAEDGLEALEAAQEEARAGLERAREGLEAAQAAHANASAEAQARRRAAERAQAAYESRRGFAQGPKNALTSGIPGVIGAVAELIRVPEPYRVAVAAALGRRSEYVVVDSADTGSRVLEHVRRSGGFVTVLPLDLVRAARPALGGAVAAAPGTVGLATDLIEVREDAAPAVWQLLGATCVVRTMEDAVALARREKRRPRLVTLDGDLVESYGAMSGGRRRTDAGVLGAAADLEEATAAAEEAEEAAAAALAALQERQEEARALLAALRAGESELTARRKEQAERRERDAARRELRRDLEERLEELARQERELVAPAREVDAAALEGAEARAEAARTAAEGARAALEGLRERHGEVARELAVQRERAEAYRVAEAQYRRDLERREGIAQRLETLGVEREEAAAALAAAERERAAAEAALPKDLGDKERAHREAAEALERCEAALAALSETQAQRAEELEGARVTLARRESALELAQEELAGFPEGLEPLDLSERAARSRLREVEAELEALGPVNHRAAQEFERERERHEELDAEGVQARLAVEELAGTLARIDRETTERLTAATEALRIGFRRHVEQLFGPAAEAEIDTEFEDERPVGLRIRLQPPGKRTQALNLLSVGERTMGAMAFLFALMSEEGRSGLPIAILDEVDAPLDEANIRRYCGFLQRQAEQGTQFVLITHQKATFEVADALWGVTTEQGVSRVFSIAKNDAVALG